MAKSLIVLVDSREKKNSHILEYFAKQRIAYEETKLDYGDYSFYIPEEAAGEDIYFHRDIVIERKASLEELSGNLSQDRERFEKEFLKAGNDGCKVYLMIEEPGGYSSVIAHKYRTEMNPAADMISFNAAEDSAELYTADPVDIRKLDKLVKSNPERFKQGSRI